jgi:tetratricopeptide (TPR) repeat protein
MFEKIRQLRGLTLAAGCLAIVLSVFLCGCESRENREVREDNEAREDTRDSINREAEAYFIQANAHVNAEMYAEAVTIYKKAIAIEANYAAAHRNMGDAYQGLEQYTDAVTAYKKAAALNPKDARAHFSVGDVCQRLNQYSAAVAAYKKSVALNPDFSDAWFGLGRSHEELGQYPQAIAAFKKILPFRRKGFDGAVMANFARASIDRVSEKMAFATQSATQPTEKQGNKR